MTPAPSKQLVELLSRLPAGQDLEYTRLMELLYETRFTGRITLDYRNGMPQQIDLGPPIKLSICHAEPGSSPGGGLDKPSGGRPR